MRIGEKRCRCWHIEAFSPCAFISQFASIRVHSRFNLPHGVALRWRGRWVLRAGHGLLIRGAAWKATLHIGLRAVHWLRIDLRTSRPRSQVSLSSFAQRLPKIRLIRIIRGCPLSPLSCQCLPKIRLIRIIRGCPLSFAERLLPEASFAKHLP